MDNRDKWNQAEKEPNLAEIFEEAPADASEDEKTASEPITAESFASQAEVGQDDLSPSAEVEEEPSADEPATEETVAEDAVTEEEPEEDLLDGEISLEEILAAAEREKPVKRPQKQGFLADLYDWLEVFAVSVAAVFVIFAFVVRVAVVDGDSMNNTLIDGEKLLVLELFYTPKQGDIIVCQDDCPQLGFDNPIVKRVIATAGQTITMDAETWTVTVDGVPLQEDYVRYIAGKPMGDWDYGESYTVPEGHVFVMGDNRTGSWDSRDDAIGPIDERYVIGKVIFRFAPFDSFGPVS